MADPADAMLDRARQFLAAADSEVAVGRLDVCFGLARTAAELAGKVLLLRRTGTYPDRQHAIGRTLVDAGVVPNDVDKKSLANLLAQHTRGDYGFGDPVHRKEATQACRIAKRMVEAAAIRP